MGRHNAYPQEITDFVREHCGEYSVSDMAEIVSWVFGIDMSYSKMRAFYKNRHLHGLPRKGRKGKSKFPEGTNEFMQQIIPGRSSEEIADLVNARFGPGTMTVEQVRTYKKNHKIPSGVDTRYKPGQVPMNKGTHPPTKGRMAETQFKKGNRPHNALPIGSEVLRDDGYLQVKIAEPDVWKLKHRLVWEQHNGPIPEGGLVVFRDGNPLNTDISNLALIDKSVNVRLNHMKIRHVESPKLFDTAVLVATIASEAGRRKRDKNQT